MTKEKLEKVYWLTWLINTVFTGLLAGFLTSHAIMFGRFLTWLVESGNTDFIRQTYTVFRDAYSPHIPYNLFFIFSLAAGILFLIISFIIRKNRIIACSAGISTFWVSFVFYATEFVKAEEAVMTAAANAQITRFYTTWNIPVHMAFAFFYTISLLLLLWVSIKDRIIKTDKAPNL